jgi:hypothetical protein
MSIELNIGLNVEGSANVKGQRDSRAEFAINSLPARSSYRREFSETEDTLIVVCEGSPADVSVVVEELAVNLSQDCIAVFNVETGAGELIGPNAAAWGEFNPEFFIRFDPADGPAQIHTPKAPAAVVRYTGHGVNTGGLQGHSVGSDYPYMIVGVQDRYEAPTRYRVMDTRNSRMSDAFPTQQRAIIEMASLRVRNCMHS